MKSMVRPLARLRVGLARVLLFGRGPRARLRTTAARVAFRRALPGLLDVIGAGLIVVAATQISPALAFLTAGAFAILFAFVLENGGKRGGKT